MVMTTFSVFTTFTVFVLGKSTSMPDSSMGAVSMNMMSSTRTTSTNGVTLMSESEVCVRPLEVVNATRYLRQICAPHRVQQAAATIRQFCKLPFLGKVALRHIHELQREVVHLAPQFLDALQEIVVGDDGRNCREQPCRRRNQRFGDAGRDAVQRRGAGGRQPLEGVNDAPHRPEQSDERRHAARSGKPA